MKSKEIRTKIASVKQTKKITNAMQMVAAGKRRKAEQRMQASLPYADKISAVIDHVIQSKTEYHNHPYLQQRTNIKHIGLLVIASDRGLCGGLNINLFKTVLLQIQDWQKKHITVDLFLIGNKAASFFKNLKMPIKTQSKSFGDKPAMEDIIGTMKVIRDAYDNKEIDQLFIAYNEFVNTMVQKPVINQLLPFTERTPTPKKGYWDYLYEPSSVMVLQNLLIRDMETQVYQAIVDNIACEQAARTVAMKSATDNASKFIDDLQLAYNKARQAAITQEIAEIIGGAEAV